MTNTCILGISKQGETFNIYYSLLDSDNSIDGEGVVFGSDENASRAMIEALETALYCGHERAAIITDHPLVYKLWSGSRTVKKKIGGQTVERKVVSLADVSKFSPVDKASVDWAKVNDQWHVARLLQQFRLGWAIQYRDALPEALTGEIVIDMDSITELEF